MRCRLYPFCNYLPKNIATQYFNSDISKMIKDKNTFQSIIVRLYNMRYNISMSKLLGGKRVEELLKQILEGQNQIIQRLDNVEQGQIKLEQGQVELKQSLARIEQEQGTKISALYDAREAQIDSNERICDSLNRIENKLERLTLRVNYNDAQLKQVK